MNIIISQKSFADQHISAKSNIYHREKIVSAHDILPYINSELASLGIGASPLTDIIPSTHNSRFPNKVHCTDKNYKGSVAVFLNCFDDGKLSNFVITTPKQNGLKKRVVKIRDLIKRGYEPREVSTQEIESLRREFERRKIDKKLATERARRHAVDLYRRARENGTSGYFERKLVKPAPGIKFDSTTAIIPVCKFKPNGNQLSIVAVQQIFENGQKLFNKNAEISGGFFPIGNRLNPQQIFFVEGVATAQSIHQSLDNPNILVVACFDSGNMPKVVAEFASHYPMIYARQGFILCADNDQWHEDAKVCFAGFKAVNAVLKQFPNCLVTYPDFDKSLADLYEKHGVVKPTDFNDYMILNGSPAVQWAVLRQAMSASEFRQLYDVKSNVLVDDDAQRELLEKISVDYKNRQFKRFASNALKSRTFINDFDEILKRINALRAEIRNNIATTNYPVARVDKQLQFVGRDDLLPQNNSESNQILDYELAAFRDYCYACDFDIQSLNPIYVTGKYLDASKIAAPRDDETVFLAVHMGAGKTTLTTQWVVDSYDKKVLTINPRKVLTQKTASDYRAAATLAGVSMAVSHYEQEKAFNYRYDGLISYHNLVTTLHSLHHFENSDLDLLILDELAQTLRCFEGNLKHGDKIYRVFCDVIRTARRVVVNGADLTQREIDFVRNLRKGKPHWFYLKPNIKKSRVVLYGNKKQLIAKIFEAIANGQDIIIPANSKGFTKNLARQIQEKFPDCKLLACHDDNANDPAQAAFLENPNAEIDKYQVVMYSPVITSGVSFDEIVHRLGEMINRSDRAIFGYFSNDVGIASDAWQMLGRYRGDTSYHVYIKARKVSVDCFKNAYFNRALRLFEAEHKATTDFLNSDVAKNPAAHHGLIRKLIKKGILPNAPVQDYLATDEYSRFVFDSVDYIARKQAIYFDDFVKQAVAQDIQVEVDNEVSTNDYEKQGRELVKQDDLTGVLSCNASPINKTQYEKLKNQSRVSQKETYKMRHFEVCESLCIESVDETAYLFFNNGVGKKVIENLEYGNSELAVLDAAKSQSEQANKIPLAQRKARMLKRQFINRLQEACGVVVNPNGGLSVIENDEFLTVQHESIRSFLSWAWENRTIINDLGFVKITKGFDKSMKWFNMVAAMCGISMLSKQVTNSSGNRERLYIVNAESLQYASDILVRRFTRIHKKRLADLDQKIDAEIAELEKAGSENFSEKDSTESLVKHWT